MQYVCDAGPYTWFRLETPGEAGIESQQMDHAVERYFRQTHEQASRTYVPPASAAGFEQSIGLKGHIQRTMPMFLTLRDNEGQALVTAMLPPQNQKDPSFRPIIVGKANGDPYPQYGEAIKALGTHLGLALDRERCFPYRRG
jgi:hypothetical protein